MTERVLVVPRPALVPEPGWRGVLDGLRREWHEEVEAAFDPQPRFVGLLNDDSTPVGRVHLGLVYAVKAPSVRSVAIRETTKLEGEWLSPPEIAAALDSMEGYSRLVGLGLLAMHGVEDPGYL